MERTLEALQQYSKQFYSTVDFNETNVVASPLGSWLLVASLANNLDYTDHPQLKEALEKTLHMPLEEAAEGAQQLIEDYPALNYVAKAWTSEFLNDLPAVQKWIQKNSAIPHGGSIPSQEEIDAWVADNTHDLITEFPCQLHDSTSLVIANIIYSKLTWSKKFHVVPAEGAMQNWSVTNVLQAEAGRRFSIYENDNHDFFAVFDVVAKGKNRERVSLITCLNRTVAPTELLQVMDNLGDMEQWEADDDFLLSLNPDMYKFKEVRSGTSPVEVEVNVPAWIASSRHNLFGTGVLGYEEVADAFGVGATTSLDVDAQQVAVAKFDAEGFEAAALTSIAVFRSAVPILREQRVYQLNFCQPFAFISYSGELPIFSGFITVAKEA